MRVLVTGANGFVGKNLIANLNTIKNGTNTTRPNIKVDEIYAYDHSSTQEELDTYCAQADVIFHLAGVNRPKDPKEFMAGNFGFSSTLLETLKKHGNKAPVMLASSIQAGLIGRYAGSDYGKSKLAGEELFFRYAKETGAKVLVYRFPNLFGKWGRPNYNSAVATFCNAVANNLPFTVNDRATELELLYIDDLVEAMLDAIEGKELHCEYPKAGEPIPEELEGNIPFVEMDGLKPTPCKTGKYCYVPTTHKVTLGEIADLLEVFKNQPNTLQLPELPSGSFVKKLYSTYLSYLPQNKTAVSLVTHADERGSFTELLKFKNNGQVSVNISKPGMTKGEHWHNTKWEFFMVVSGQARIQQRKIGTEEVWSWEVSGEQPQMVHMLPGYTHNITNISKTQDLVTVMWANEQFDPEHPDTFRETVEKK